MGNRGKARALIALARNALAIAMLAAPAAYADACRDDQVMLRGDWGQARFTVELADDEAERNKGLMHRKSMPKSAGMLFVYPSAGPVGFWMRNTLIPLDMLFLDPTGTVTLIHHNAVPLDETPIMGGDNILAVLEINGGMAGELGIKTGSQLRHPAFAAGNAAWPCLSSE